MSRAVTLLAAAASLVLCLWAGRRYHTSRADATVSMRQLAMVKADAHEIASFLGAAPPEFRRLRPAPGLARHIADVVSRAGLPQSALQNLSAETETLIGDESGLRRQVARLTLDCKSLPELGQFLQQWRTQEPAWTVSSIDITPAPAKKQPSAGQPTDRALRAMLSIETIFADKEGR